MLRIASICAVAGLASFGLVGSLADASTATTSASVPAALATSANAHHKIRSDAVTAWNANAAKAAIAACMPPNADPLHESRLYAMAHVAIHDALNAIDRRSRPYAFNARASRGASPDAAVAAAARDVLVAVLSQPPAIFPPECGVAGVASVEADYAARLYGLLNMALTDGYIGSFDTKYHYNYWRPVTAIQTAATDGNPNTSADPTWTPLVTTPPVPDYDSAHSVEGGAAAMVLKRFFGTDHISFETCSLTLPAGSTCTDPTPVRRRYTSFSQAAAENGLSRILNGFHFRKAVDEGIEHGGKIADRAVDRFLRPAN